MQQNAAPSEISAAGQLVMLTQRIGKSANEFLTMEGVSPEAVFLLGKDLNSFKEIAQGLLDGSPELRLAGSKDPQTREQLDALIKLYEQTRSPGGRHSGQPAGSGVGARGAVLDHCGQRAAAPRPGKPAGQAVVATGLGAGAVDRCWSCRRAVCAAVRRSAWPTCSCRTAASARCVAEAQRLEAERQEQEAKRVNDANQAAILRLMNELQTVAEGDLTQEATVTEDITGAIADSVNYTVEELRSLVGSVQNTATRVAQTTAEVESTSTELLAASNEQLREIRETGQSVVDMATRINEVSVAGAGIGQGGAPVAAGRGVGSAGGAERHRRHELDPRPDPGNLQADQAAGRILAGDWRNHRADFRHYRADQRAGPERRHSGRLGR